MKITHNEMIKEIRKTARNNGLVFKKQNATIDTLQAYKFTNRSTGLLVADNFTIKSAYENCLSGYVDLLKQG